MMNFLAVYLCGDGSILRNEDTSEVMNLQLGEFETKELAIKQACSQLECTHYHNGVLTKGDGQGGYLIVDAQEFTTV
ncbi:hypothetical protein [Grimontia marina]|uniref:Uncharacterized protein n=1 Tax=Grimontia marina TaxID=646534 RepID=A0A128F9I0_9GAMM|nr:hypothetical protein [Grimontia marina]CZF83160.1 hypothetical protein GMA8713_02505 [Grimontia marina]